MFKEIYASQVLRGDKIVGSNEWHVRVESVKRTAKRIVVVGLNGYGEEIRSVFMPNAKVELVTI